MREPLHPAPEPYRIDHRETHRRSQLDYPSELIDIYRRVVEGLADELQIDPYNAHILIRDGCEMVSRGLAWEMWPLEWEMWS